LGLRVHLQPGVHGQPRAGELTLTLTLNPQPSTLNPDPNPNPNPNLQPGVRDQPHVGEAERQAIEERHGTAARLGCPRAQHLTGSKAGGGEWDGLGLGFGLGGGVGGFGGGSLEHPRQWLGIRWRGLSPWECQAAPSRQACPAAVRGACWGAAQAALRPCWPTAIIATMPKSERMTCGVVGG
jgi:hypothetical protein